MVCSLTSTLIGIPTPMSNCVLPFSSPSPSTSPTLTESATPSEPQSPFTENLPIQMTHQSHRMLDSQTTAEMNSFATMESSCAALQSSDSFYDDSISLPERPEEAHTRERSLYGAPRGAKKAHDPFSDENALTTPPKPSVEDIDGDAASVKSSETFHTAVLVGSPSAHQLHGLRRTDIVPRLTRDRRFRRGNSQIRDPNGLPEKSHRRGDVKLRLARAKEEVRVLQSLDPRASTSRFSLRDPRSKSCFDRREIEHKNLIPSLVRSWFFWASLLLMLAGISQTSAAAAAAAFTVAKKADGVEGNRWIIFWLVCSMIALIVGGAAMSVVFMEKGNACRGILKRMGLNEVRNVVGRDLESGRSGGLLYLGICDREGTSMLGESSEDNRVQVLASSRRSDGQSTTGSSKTVSIHTADYNSIQDPRWRDLYTPNRSRHTASISRTAPHEPMRQKVSQQDEEDIGAQHLRPTPPMREFDELVSYIPGRKRAISRVGLHKDDIEMANLGGAKNGG